MVIREGVGEIERVKAVAPKSNIRFNTKVNKLSIFDEDTNKVVDFAIIY